MDGTARYGLVAVSGVGNWLLGGSTCIHTATAGSATLPFFGIDLEVLDKEGNVRKGNSVDGVGLEITLKSTDFAQKLICWILFL